MREIKELVIHCADTPSSMDIGAEEINQWHTERGWSGIGYHKVIRRDGTIEDGRPIATVGAHAKGHNTHSIGVCLVGGKHGFNFTAAQIASMMELVVGYCEEYPGLDVIGHNEISEKDCPCFDVQSLFSA